MRRLLFLSFTGLFLGSVMSCSSPDTDFIAVDLSTDYVSLVDFARVRVSVWPEGSELSTDLLIQAESRDYVRPSRIAQFDSMPNGSYLIEIQLLRENGQILGSRRFQIVNGGGYILTARIDASCAEISCPRPGGDGGATECQDGACVPPTCLTPGECGQVECQNDEECVGEAPIACKEPVCVLGSCRFRDTPEVCGAEEYCDVQLGCTRRNIPSVDAGVDAGTDVAMDTTPAECGQPCDFPGQECEAGVYDCSSGTPVCVSAGPMMAGESCRAAVGACDADDTCNGTDLTCADEKRAAGFECRAAANSCDVAEVCDGTNNACPADVYAPVGTSCAGGFCDESGMCSNSCNPGAACTPAGQPCRTGAIDCSSGTPTCVANGNVSNGTMCGATNMGSWGSCGGFSNSCDETGTRSRNVTTYTCQAGSCESSTTSESESCSRGTSGISCGAGVSYGSWSGCGGFSGTCDETGTRTRSVTTYACGSGTCQSSTTTETGACSRNTNGTSCGSTGYGGWGACGGFSNTCDETGTRSRSMTTYTCGGGTCQSSTTSQSGSCSRSTSGNSCGSTAYGNWGACGGFSNTCDETGTRSRSVTTYTCGSGSCQTSSSSQSGSCSRSTSGNSCGTTTYGPWSPCSGFSSICDNTGTRSRSVTTYACGSQSCQMNTTTETTSCTRNTNGTSCNDFSTCRLGTCNGGSCSYSGPPCNSPSICCEPGVCIPQGDGCP